MFLTDPTNFSILPDAARLGVAVGHHSATVQLSKPQQLVSSMFIKRPSESWENSVDIVLFIPHGHLHLHPPQVTILD